jgi:putative ABC transport system permease protein
MRLLRTLKLGAKSLLLHPMRSALTVLGIFIGVASVIWLLAIGEGISLQAQKQIEDLGAENIIVRSVEPPDQGSASFRDIPTFGISREEFRMIEKTIPTIERVIPIREVTQKFVYTGNPRVQPIDGRLVGCTPEYAEVTRLNIARGHFLTDREIQAQMSVCVVSARLAERFFPSEDPIEKQIYLPDKQEYFNIVGVLEHRNATAAIGGSLASQDFSRDIYIPITTMRLRMGDLEQRRSGGSFSAKKFELTQITAQVADVSDVPRTAKLVEASLRNGFTNRNRQDIAVVVPYELLEQAKATRIMFMMFMGLIAAISLIVGGIGIMNIMLATVTERTREIGIRRALGGRRSDIVQQFLVETIFLSVIGGLTGIIGGLLCPWTVSATRAFLSRFLPDFYDRLPDVARLMQPQIVPLSIPLAFFISVVVGVFFGLYPAIRASRMEPIEALRHE